MDKDPFPQIPPALLNSADIADYIRMTGMVRPYDPKHLKSASYAISIGSTLIYWNDEKKRIVRELTKDEPFELFPNYIMYVTTEEKFELPPYIAMRFNLHIEFVHAGLLLGTGPLVDPGWGGHLLIPIHNLTSNTVCLHQGQELIWVEFTKVSPNNAWLTDSHKIPESERQGRYQEFNREKKNMSPLDYLGKALAVGKCEQNFVRSSIPDSVVKANILVENAKNEAQTAKNGAVAAQMEAEKSRRYSAWVSFGGAIAVAALLIALMTGLWPVYSDVRNLVAQTHSDFETKVTSDITGQKADTTDQKAMIAAKLAELESYRKQKAKEMDDRLTSLEKEIIDLKQQLAHGNKK